MPTWSELARENKIFLWARSVPIRSELARENKIFLWARQSPTPQFFVPYAYAMIDGVFFYVSSCNPHIRVAYFCCL
jgi:hypothetical protein